MFRSAAVFHVGSMLPRTYIAPAQLASRSSRPRRAHRLAPGREPRQERTRHAGQVLQHLALKACAPREVN